MVSTGGCDPPNPGSKPGTAKFFLFFFNGKKKFSKKKKKITKKNAPGGIRTHDFWLIRPTL